jgi:hypothetical protein
MSLSDEFQSASPQKKNQIERAIDQLEGADLRDFIGALHNVSITAAAISKVLAKRGIHVDARRIAEYRNNGGRVRYGLKGEKNVAR